MEDDNFIAWDDTTVTRAVASAARVSGRRFSQFASRDDLTQECWLWTLSHPAKLDEWRDLGDYGRKKLVRALINHCTAHGQKEKAEQTGYRVGDNYHYGVTWLREFIPVVFAKGMDQNSAVYAEFEDRAMWMDVCNAIGSLSESEYEILRRAFADDPAEEQGYLNVADFLSLSYDAARQRVNRVLRKLQAYLGGENPIPPRRKVRSNAQARADTSSQYDPS